MGRAPCCVKDQVKKGAWTPEEDKILVGYITEHGHGTWRSLPKLTGLGAVWNTAKAEPGSIVAVFGPGTIGLAQ